ncbi:MAG: enoyl-CoA hydratase [Litoreibacter sp.]|nr:enoyl-CoA hydratase [Litoreibacter sp.]MCY4333807.1 enoyl-CoA hydratase [Litoreibacter sp.]
MNDTLLLRETRGTVAWLTMNNPAKLNALSDEMLAALQSTFSEIAESDQVKAVVLRGAGKAFCAGHDLRQMTDKRQAEDDGAAGFKDLFDRCAEMMMTIRKMPQPVIASVHGIATAAGCQLVASCDLAVAEEGTRFGVNGVNIGLFCSTPMVALSRNIARKQAFEMLVTGDFIDASRARDLGLVNRVATDLDAETAALSEQVASKLGLAVRYGKGAFYDQMEMGLAEAYAFTGDVMVANMAERDTKEGIAAFLEKREPDWNS